MELPWWARILPFATYHVKNIFDSADGGLARARGVMDRLGRFMDSVVDFIVSAAVFSAMAIVAMRRMESLLPLAYAIMAFFLSTFSISFYVYYTIKFAEELSLATASRSDEELKRRDIKIYEDGYVQRAYEFLYALYRLFYLWQDKMIAAADAALFRWIARARIMRGLSSNRVMLSYAYYTDRRLLSFISLAGLGCHIALGSIAILAGAYVLYFKVTIVYSAAILLIASAWRYFSFAGRRRLFHIDRVDECRY